MKLTIIYRKLYDWEWVGGERKREIISQGKVRRSLNEINKMRLCQLFSNNARRTRQRSANNIFPRFHPSKIRSNLGSGWAEKLSCRFPSVLIFLSINGINTFNFIKTLKLRIRFCHTFSDKIVNRKEKIKGLLIRPRNVSCADKYLKFFQKHT